MILFVFRISDLFFYGAGNIFGSLENIIHYSFIRLHLGFKPYIWLHFCSLMFKNRVQYNIRIHLYTAAGDGNMLKFDMNLFSWSISIAQRLTSCFKKLCNILTSNDYFIRSKVASILVLMQWFEEKKYRIIRYIFFILVF